MRGEVIPIDSVSRSAAREHAVADGFTHFTKALAAVKSMNGLSVVETKETLAEWVRGGLLTETEHGALMQFYGWERG